MIIMGEAATDRYYQKDYLMHFTNYLLRNSFCILCELKRVPQGGNLSPPLADITLAVLEFSFSKSIKWNSEYIYIFIYAILIYGWPLGYSQYK